MIFVLAVEGETEREAIAQFIKRWLDERMTTVRVGVRPAFFRGSAKFTREIARFARGVLDDPTRTDVVAVIGLLDLYGLPFYPDDVDSSDERYEWAKRHFEGLVDRERFQMFFAVHEVEAWLLSQPEIFPRAAQPEVQKTSNSPERVNFQMPPSKVLADVYRRRLTPAAT